MRSAPKRLTDSERYSIVADRLRGATLGELAHRYQCSTEAVRQLLLKQQGTPGGRLAFRVDRHHNACVKRDAAVRQVAQATGADAGQLRLLFGLPARAIRRAIGGDSGKAHPKRGIAGR